LYFAALCASVRGLWRDASGFIAQPGALRIARK
jgi:hypothetical protein